MGIKIFQVDAFTNESFRGNPAAVCILEEELSDELYLKIAMEMNLSETAFVVKTPDENRFKLRWFTPECEVSLCGHATLSAAHCLFKQYGLQGEILFDTKSGRLKAEAHYGNIMLDFPARIPLKTEREICDIQRALNCSECFSLFRSDNSGFLLLLFETERAVVELKPDFSKLKELEFEYEVHGLIVTARSDGQEKDYDFCSRVFVPWLGINEDPVTGSAHTLLGPFWAERLGKSTVRGYQASNRGGYINVEHIEENRVMLTGEAVLILEGILNV